MTELLSCNARHVLHIKRRILNNASTTIFSHCKSIWIIDANLPHRYVCYVFVTIKLMRQYLSNVFKQYLTKKKKHFHSKK